MVPIFRHSLALRFTGRGLGITSRAGIVPSSAPQTGACFVDEPVSAITNASGDSDPEARGGLGKVDDSITRRADSRDLVGADGRLEHGFHQVRRRPHIPGSRGETTSRTTSGTLNKPIW